MVLYVTCLMKHRPTVKPDDDIFNIGKAIIKKILFKRVFDELMLNLFTWTLLVATLVIAKINPIIFIWQSSLSWTSFVQCISQIIKTVSFASLRLVLIIIIHIFKFQVYSIM